MSVPVHLVACLCRFFSRVLVIYVNIRVGTCRWRAVNRDRVDYVFCRRKCSALAVDRPSRPMPSIVATVALRYVVLSFYTNIWDMLAIDLNNFSAFMSVPPEVILFAYKVGIAENITFPCWLKIRKQIVATRCHILKVKYTKFDFAWGPPKPRCGSLQRSPRIPRWISQDLLLKEGMGESTEGKGEGGERG